MIEQQLASGTTTKKVVVFLLHEGCIVDIMEVPIIRPVAVDIEPKETDDWRDSAACKGINPELMCPDNRDSDAVAIAKSICASCVVCVECLDHAMSTRERFGVYGGLTERERMRLRRSGNGL